MKNMVPRLVLLCGMVLTLASPALAQQLGKGQVKELVATVDADGVQRVEVIAGSYYFNPNRIVVKAGVPLELKLRKVVGLAPHDFVLKAPEAGLDVFEALDSKGKTVTVTPTKAGTYAFHCSKKVLIFPSHRDSGMEGVLVVVE
jgi:plastocyanin